MMLKRCLLSFLIRLFLTSGGETQPALESLKPQRVRFQSRNFHNILRWQPGRTLDGNHSVYFVQYKVYGQEKWQDKEDCWGIPALSCDLTNETSDLQEPYYGRVRTASSDWSRTRRFTPWWETKLDPPVVTLARVNASLLVVLRAPNFPYRGQNGQNASMEIHYDFVYRVFIISNLLEKEQKVYEGIQRVIEIEAPVPHSRCCVVADLYQPMLDRRSQRSKETCV